MKVKEVKGLIFDCDGTLADTMPLHWRVWHALTRRHGIDLSEDRFYSLGGVPSKDILKTLGQEQGLDIDHIALAYEKEAAYRPLIAQIEPINVVVGIARKHHGQIPMAVASGGTREIINQVLTQIGIRELFDAVVTHEDVKRQKPAPDIFLEAARRIGVAPKFCRAYEDTEIGLEAIRSAGMEAVDVRTLLEAIPTSG